MIVAADANVTRPSTGAVHCLLRQFRSVASASSGSTCRVGHLEFVDSWSASTDKIKMARPITPDVELGFAALGPSSGGPFRTFWPRRDAWPGRHSSLGGNAPAPTSAVLLSSPTVLVLRTVEHEGLHRGDLRAGRSRLPVIATMTRYQGNYTEY